MERVQKGRGIMHCAIRGANVASAGLKFVQVANESELDVSCCTGHPSCLNELKCKDLDVSGTSCKRSADID